MQDAELCSVRISICVPDSGLFAELNALAEQFNFERSVIDDVYSPRWNIPPTASVLTIRYDSESSGLVRTGARMTRWGMTGVGSGRRRWRLFNARAETVQRLPSFRGSFTARRCIVPASGFYEWKKGASGAQTPMWFQRRDEAAIGFAGIWTREIEAGNEIETCSIITCEANRLVGSVHHRIPVVLSGESQVEWLNPDTELERLTALLHPVEWNAFEYYAVSNAVNRTENDHAGLCCPVCVGQPSLV